MNDKTIHVMLILEQFLYYFFADFFNSKLTFKPQIYVALQIYAETAYIVHL